MPQFDLGMFASQIFWLLVSFGSLWAFAAFVAVPSIAGCIKKREALIQQALDEIDAMTKEIEENNDYVDKLLQEAKLKINQMLKKAKEEDDQIYAEYLLKTESLISKNSSKTVKALALEIELYRKNMESIVNEVVDTVLSRLRYPYLDSNNEAGKAFHLPSSAS